jgi:hypothetical protein
MNNTIKKCIEHGRLILLLGAGASLTSSDRRGDKLLSSDQLAKRIADLAGWTYKNENIATVYSAGLRNLGEQLNDELEKLYKHCNPSYEYSSIAKQSWARIYTLNIDDAFEKALNSFSPQLINVRHRFDKISDQDQLFHQMDYIKLNGSIDRLRDGLIFSPKEYGAASASPPLWYRELAHDFFRYTFLFIGTKLDEPLFYHQIERYLVDTKIAAQTSYVLTPSATEIEKESLLSYNLIHIPGTLLDFEKWLDLNFPIPLKPTEIAIKRNPALGRMLSLTDATEKAKFPEIFKDVTIVSRLALSSDSDSQCAKGQIRQFYKGFKPQWKDILDEVPARITAIDQFYSRVENALTNNSNLLVVYGPAGSGKTTLLMNTALAISDNKNIPVYFLNTAVDNLKQIIGELEKINADRYCLFYDRLEAVASELREIKLSGILKKGLIIGSERQHKWESIVREHLSNLSDKPFQLHDINKSDANLILEKLKKFGPWTRLSNMKHSERINELFEKSHHQLLIGLLETTVGDGFEKIIEDEFSHLGDSLEQQFVIIVGFATIHRYSLRESFASRALANLDKEANIIQLANKLSGIISYSHYNLVARHPVYIQHLFDTVIDADTLYNCLTALLSAYTVYEAPVIIKLNRNDSNLFKALFNHKFLKYLFREKYNYIIGIYKSFEKAFENDGLFWLQYGLALRDFSMHAEAFEKLLIAFEAHPQPHTEHALAQQEIILACKATNKSKAFDLLDSAKKRLESLDKIFQSFDTYPIVTLSEGHTQVIKLHEGEDAARKLAKHYANIIESRLKTHSGGRLKKTWTRLSTYGLTGEWIEDEQFPFIC